MAFVHGKNTHISIDDESGTLVDISSYSDSVSGLPGAVELATITGCGDRGVKSIPGLENTTFSVSGSYEDTTLDGVIAGLAKRETTTTFEYGPAGSATGKRKLSGECWCTSVTIESSVSDKTSWSAEFQVDGVVELGVFD